MNGNNTFLQNVSIPAARDNVPQQSGKLIGKVALVTGASSGIGEATALALAAQAALVVIAARRTERLESLAQRILKLGGQVAFAVIDVTSEEQILSLVEEIQFNLGRLDILINNAGIVDNSPIATADTDNWRRMFNTNVLGLMYATQAAVRVMKRQQSGHIVNISSTAGRGVSAGIGAYCATKWSVNAFSEGLRQEVSTDNIRVTVIEPGPVATELVDGISNAEIRSSVQQWFDSMTVLQPEDIAEAIVYALTQPARVNVNEILIRPTAMVAAV